MHVHQLLPCIRSGDAISGHAIALKRLLRRLGYPSEIYAEDPDAGVAAECRPLCAFDPRAGAVAIYHYSTAFEPVTELFFRHRGRRGLIYHNITPHRSFIGHDRVAYAATLKARDELPRFRDVVDLSLGDSVFNCRELTEVGYRNPRVLPILLDLKALESTLPCPQIMERLRDGWTNFLFVGRLMPHKCQQDVISVFAHYQRRVNRRSRLVLVGRYAEMMTYRNDLADHARRLGVEDHVEFAGHVRFAELLAYYRAAHVLVCMSEHEGFCVPLIEAMACDVPIVAYAAAGVRDTLGPAGIMVDQKDFGLIAELAQLLIEDRELRARIITGQRERLRAFAPETVAATFQRYVEELLSPP